MNIARRLVPDVQLIHRVHPIQVTQVTLASPIQPTLQHRAVLGLPTDSAPMTSTRMSGDNIVPPLAEFARRKE